MSINSMGRILKFTSYGESHGPAIGCILDGVPPQIPLTVDDIQPYLDKRRPGQNKYTTQRREADQVEILSGVFDGRTTGTPIHLLIRNTDQRSKDYSEIANKYRPGHADYTYDRKYGFRDPRGGGRSSARETATRVAAGAVARKILSHAGYDIDITAAVIQIGKERVKTTDWDKNFIQSNPFFCPDPAYIDIWSNLIDSTRLSGDSLGALIRATAMNLPAGWGAPVYGKLDADLAANFMSINAVKGVDIGAGFDVATMTGSQNSDEMGLDDNGNPLFLTNHAGGILGGISSGAPIECRIAIKPTSSILTPQQSINQQGEIVQISTKGRHDPCVGIRAVPVVEAMMALTLADHMMLHRAQCG